LAGGDSFEEFYATAYRRIVGQVFALLGDLHEAEDLTQDAFAKASFRRSRIGAYDAPEAWVRRVAFNQARNRARRARRGLVALARHGPRTWRRTSPRTGWTSTAPCGSSRFATARSSSCTTSQGCPWKTSPASFACRSAPPRAGSTAPARRWPGSSPSTTRVHHA
jgi:hypothetical protein